MLKSSMLMAVPALATLLACSASDDTPRQPLGASAPDAASQVATGPVLPPAAKNALDAGNAAYREKKFDLAIAKYREAAIAAPTHAAPWFGVFMAANEIKNTALADSAMTRVNALSADSTALGAHVEATGAPVPGGALPPGHPSTETQLPPGHPTTQPQLPAGHPAPVKKP